VQEAIVNVQVRFLFNKKSFQNRLLFVLALAIAPLVFSETPATAPSDDAAVRDRANLLHKQMTLEEKIGQLSQLFDFGKEKAIDHAASNGQLGSLLLVTGPAEINGLQHLAVDHTCVHIPLIFGFDVIHGFRTICPQSPGTCRT
jgi:beta-glucosidase